MKSKFFQNYMKQFDDMPKAFRKSKYIFVYLMVSLAIVNFIVFYVVVNLNSILLAFQEFIGYDENYVEQYVWSLGNFKSMFKEFALPNSTVGIAVRNTLKYFATQGWDWTQELIYSAGWIDLPIPGKTYYFKGVCLLYTSIAAPGPLPVMILPSFSTIAAVYSAPSKKLSKPG